MLTNRTINIHLEDAVGNDQELKPIKFSAVGVYGESGDTVLPVPVTVTTDASGEASVDLKTTSTGYIRFLVLFHNGVKKHIDVAAGSATTLDVLIAAFDGTQPASGTVRLDDLESDVTALQAADAQNVKLTGNQNIAGVKAFASSPTVPTPTTDLQAANKAYVDENAGGLDPTALHKTGNETIASGVKTFAQSPIVPTPTTDTQAANKAYVDEFNTRLRVLEFDGTPQSVDFGIFYPFDEDLGPCLYENLQKETEGGGSGRYDWSEGYGGSHAMLRNATNGNIFKGGIITNATNTSPIVVTTAVAHGLTTGDSLFQIKGVLGNTAANGFSPVVTVLSATTFSINGSVGNGAYISGGIIYDRIVSFGADDVPYPGQWAYSSTGFSDGLIVQYYDGVPVGKSVFVGARLCANLGGNGHGFMGGSDHNNFMGRLAQYRIWEGVNPHSEALLGGNNLNAHIIETVFGAVADYGPGVEIRANLLVDFYSPQQTIQDKSSGFPEGRVHAGKIRGTGANVSSHWSSYPGPQFVVDEDVPNALGLTVTPQPAGKEYTPLGVPAGALVFDSFQRKNSTWAFDNHGGMGTTEGGSLGPLNYSERDLTGAGIYLTTKQFGILNEKGVALGNSIANFSGVNTGHSALDIRVSRTPSDVWGMGISTGIMFRGVDTSNFWIAFTSGTSRSTQLLYVIKYVAGAPSTVINAVAMPASWTTLRVVTRPGGTFEVYADATLVSSATDADGASGTFAGVGYGNQSGIGLDYRYINLTVYEAADLLPTITTTTLPNGGQGASYNETIVVSSGDAPLTLSVLSGSLPTGLTLNASTGVISGTATVQGVYNFTVRVTDSDGDTDDQALTITIDPAYAPSDADAIAYIAAAGITNDTQKQAIDNLIIGLKADGLWTKAYAVYPIMGGTAASHKWNAKNPLDTDGAFRLTFAGGLTHSATGILPNGSSGYMNTHLAPASVMSDDNHSWALYSRTNLLDASGQFDIGALTGGTGIQAILRTSILGGSQVLSDALDSTGGGGRATGTVADSLGLFADTRTASNAHTVYKNGTSVATAPNPDSTAISALTQPFYIGARNSDGAAASFSTREIAFAWFGSGLNGTQAANLYTRVQAFQTALGRNV